MPTIDLTSAYRNSASPKIQGRNVEAARPATGNFRISKAGSGFGGQPNVIEWRTFLDGVGGQDINLVAGAGEIGNYTNNLLSLPKFFRHDDGFMGMVVRNSRIGPETSVYLNHTATDEFRIHYMECVPNDWAFPGTSQAKTTPGASVCKSRWPSKGDGQGGAADICVPTYVSDNIYISGNTAQPNWGGGALVKFDDFWDFTGRNCVGHYQKAGTPSPVVNDGYLEAYFSSKKTGGTKTTNTKFISSTEPVFGTGTDIDPLETEYDRCYKWSYFITPAGAKPFVSNLLTNYAYHAIGANSKQCLFLLNANTRDTASLLYAYHATSWTDDDIYFSTNTFDMTYATHAGVLKPDGSWQIATLESLRI